MKKRVHYIGLDVHKETIAVSPKKSLVQPSLRDAGDGSANSVG